MAGYWIQRKDKIWWFYFWEDKVGIMCTLDVLPAGVLHCRRTPTPPCYGLPFVHLWHQINLIFPIFFLALLALSFLKYFAHCHSSSSKFSSLASLGISFLNLWKLEVKVLPVAIGFPYFKGTRCTPKPHLLLVTGFISCNMKRNTVMTFYLF